MVQHSRADEIQKQHRVKALKSGRKLKKSTVVQKDSKYTVIRYSCQKDISIFFPPLFLNIQDKAQKPHVPEPPQGCF